MGAASFLLLGYGVSASITIGTHREIPRFCMRFVIRSGEKTRFTRDYQVRNIRNPQEKS
jgi:hypothetical protein